MPRMTGGRALVESLQRHGVDTLFVLPGVQNDAFFNALYDAGDDFRVIHTRHEQGAAYMAYGYAKSTGRVGAYCVVPGPGVLNTTAALSTAYATNAPVLCVTGQIASNMIGRGFGLLHELPDQLSILRGLTKWAARIDHPTQVQPIVDEAFRQLQSGRPRPVAIEMPQDMMALETEVTFADTQLDLAVTQPDPTLIARAADLLANAQRPLIIVGSGVEDAGDCLCHLAELLQAPVASVSSGHGSLDSRHYLSVRGPMGHHFWADADVVVAVGTRLQRPLTAWGVDDKLKLIRIDVDPIEIGRIHPPTVGIVADASVALAALYDALVARGVSQRPSREAEMINLKADFETRYAEIQPQYDFLMTIREELPEDGLLVDEVTQVGYTSAFAFPVYRPRTLISSGYQGTLGYGFATALGVKVAHPDKPVISVNGDGGFMYTVQELATAVQQGIGLVSVVFADGAFGNVQRMQKELYGGRVIASNLHNPDFVKLAESFGAHGARATSLPELRQALRDGFSRQGPTLIEVPVGAMTAPWKYIMLPRVRGQKT